MRYATRMVLGAMVAMAVLGVPSSAQAGWPLASGRSAPVLGFGASYGGDGNASVHRGLDLAGQSGESVVAPLAGTVTFVGRVPGVGGGTVLAVTLLTSEGSVTLLPLDRVSVVRGDTPAEGTPIATLAEAGDASSSATHLHIGLRAGTLYLDPTKALGSPPVPAPDPDPAADEVGALAVDGAVVAPSAAGAATGAQASAGAGVGGTAASGVGAANVAGALTPGMAGAGAELPAVSGAENALGATTGELAPGVSLASGSGVPASGFEPAGVLADTGQALATGGRLARAASSAVDGHELGALAARGIRMAKRGARTGALLATGILCALGALWPLWRAGGVEGLGKVPVRAMREDVAAVASR